MTPLPLLIRIRMKIVVIWHVLLGYGVMYRVDITGKGTIQFHAKSNPDILYIAESNILDWLEV